MLVQKTHLMWLAVILVIAGGFYFDERLDDAQYQRDRARVEASCVREVTRDAYEAGGFLLVSERVDDKEGKLKYEAVAQSIAVTFPQPPGLDNPLKMIETEYVQQANGIALYRLSEASSELIEAGCRQAFQD
jgi:hypothetical protein